MILVKLRPREIDVAATVHVCNAPAVGDTVGCLGVGDVEKPG